MFKKLILLMTVAAPLVFTVNAHASETSDPIETINITAEVNETVEKLTTPEIREAKEIIDAKTEPLTEYEQIMLKKLNQEIESYEAYRDRVEDAKKLVIGVVVIAIFFSALLFARLQADGDTAIR